MAMEPVYQKLNTHHPKQTLLYLVWPCADRGDRKLAGESKYPSSRHRDGSQRTTVHWTMCKLETPYPKAAFTVAMDFNKGNLGTHLLCYINIT